MIYFFSSWKMNSVYNKSYLVSPPFAGMSTAEDEWYNKSLTALRMNSAHPANLTTPVLQYQS